MVKFTLTNLSNGTLEVTGPAEADSGFEVTHVRFMVAQGDVIVEGGGEVSGSGWKGAAPAGGLQPGPAHGFGLAVMLNPSPPARYETLTWVEAIALT